MKVLTVMGGRGTEGVIQMRVCVRKRECEECDNRKRHFGAAGLRARSLERVQLSFNKSSFSALTPEH